MKLDEERVYQAIHAELERQTQEGDVYLYGTWDDEIMGVDGHLNVRQLAKKIVEEAENDPGTA